jgi:hypothetical protein
MQSAGERGAEKKVGKKFGRRHGWKEKEKLRGDF